LKLDRIGVSDEVNRDYVESGDGVLTTGFK